MDSRIFWLASFPKSGNTWMRAMFSAYINYGHVDINNLVGSYSDSDNYFLRAVAHKPLKELTYVERQMLRPGQMLHLQETSPFDPVLVKTHSINGPLEGYPTIPAPVTKGALLIVRDPRDVVVSYADHMGLSIDEAIGALADPNRSIREEGMGHPRCVVGSWSTHTQSWLDETRFQVSVMCYEDMVENPLWAFGVFLDLLGWKPDERRLKFAVEACSFEKLQTQESEKGFKEASSKSERFFRQGRVGAWADILTPDEAVRIEEYHGDVMSRFGYFKKSAA